ncbi:MAG: ATP-dependent RecD-like DNA helicase [Erysipelotrichaceae bacterium]|nr:ATP-dependent RecD-like DNA helicase [Erysipelotrichaceae bacterium]
MTITGHFIKTIYHNTNGYTVAVFELSDRSEDEVVVTGYLPEMDREVEYELHGNYAEHPRYGMQFNIESFEKMRIKDEDNLIHYLSGPEFKGIGPKMATSIVETLGIEAVDIIRADNSVLDQVKGMTEKKKEAILAGLEKDTDDKYYFLTSNHLSMKMIMRLEMIYGEDLMHVVKHNPYQMVRDVDGIGFVTADKFARSIGFEDDHPYRLEAFGVYQLMQWCVQRGDSYMLVDEFRERLDRSMDCDNYDLDEIMNGLIATRQVVVEEDRIYPISQYEAEEYIAQYLSLFPAQPFEKADPQDITEGIREIEEEFGITYQDRQKEAIEAFFDSDVMILTGGPGTGKTTIVRGMVKLCRRLFPQYNVTLCAPTGRASKRLSELTECDARTVHSLLRWDKDTGRFAKNEDDPLDIDLLIIDEISMLDQWVFYNLFKAGINIRKLILIGDQDQLPSVGIGCVLKDLIDSDCFKVVRLEKIYRQQEGSDIISLADEIKRDVCEDVVSENDIRFFECDPYQIRNLTLQVVEHALSRYPDIHDGFMNVQVLVPKYNGINGIDALNVALQKQFNPPDRSKRELQVGYRTYRVGDKILQLKNQPDDDVFNGDIGILEEIVYSREDVNNQNRMVVDFDGIIVEYTSETFMNITHAYCISVHKAQGSEYPIVIMPMANEYGIMLQKRLLYTAVSRAYESLIMIGQKQAFLNGVKRRDHYERKTTLKDRILRILG